MTAIMMRLGRWKGPHWRRMKRRDTEAVEQILFDRERYCVGAISRYLDRSRGWVYQNGPAPAGASAGISPGAHADAPAGISAGVSENISALILNSHHSLFHILCRDADEDAGVSARVPFPPFMKRMLRSYPLHTVQGLREDVEFLEGGITGLGREPVEEFDYDLMVLDREPDFGKAGIPLPGLVLRRPTAADMEELFELQSAYEMEEVLPEGTVFNPAVSRLNLARILADEQILAAELDGRIVGKINTSAESFTRRQIGGVYVHPRCRALGIGRRMTAEFTRSLIRQGWGVSLFVKKRNAAARNLYLGLGFERVGNYRISYY
jgi:ribosomal protein S18 acetylase RimI-like enzyme